MQKLRKCTHYSEHQNLTYYSKNYASQPLYTAYHSGNYFIWNVSSSYCQQYIVQCAATSHNQNKTTYYNIRHTTDHVKSTVYSILLNTQHQLPYTSPGTVHHFELSAITGKNLLVRDYTTKVG